MSYEPDIGRRFMRFSHSEYNCGGGLGDLDGVYETWEQAAARPVRWDCEEIYDTWTGRTWYPYSESPLKWASEFRYDHFKEPSP